MKKRAAAAEAEDKMQTSWVKLLLLSGAAFAFALLATAPAQLQATTAEQAYREGQNAGNKAYEDDRAPEDDEEEEEGGCCGGGGGM